MVAVLWDLIIVAPEELEIARLHRFAEVFHLIAGIVDVVFLVADIAGFVQHSRQRITEGAAAGIAHVQEPRWIGADKFHLHTLAAAGVRLAVVGVFLLDGRKHTVQPAWDEVEIDKARSGDLHALHESRQIDAADDGFGDLARILAQDARQLHGEVCREIAVLFILRRLDDKVRQRRLWQRACSHRLRAGCGNALAQRRLCFFNNVQ